MTATVGVAVRDVDPPSRSLWYHPDFLKFWFGETVSLLGTQVTILALPLTAIHVLGASDEQVGLLRFLQLAPYIGLALLLGVWVDRMRRRHVMLWSNGARMLLIGLIPVLYWLGVLNTTWLLLIACAIGIASVAFDPSWMAYVPTLVNRQPRHYVEANSKIGISYSTAEVAGPGIAGVLVSLLTAPVALISQVFTYLVSMISLLLIRTTEPRPQGPSENRRALRELHDGVRFVFGNPILRWLAIIGFWERSTGERGVDG